MNVSTKTSPLAFRRARPGRRVLRPVAAILVAAAMAMFGLPAMPAAADSSDTHATVTLQIASQITVTSSANPAAAGSDVTLTATFAVIAGNSDISPTGSVTFLDGGTPVGTGTLAGPTASWKGPLPVGAHQITVSYAGDGTYTSADSPPLSLDVTDVPVVSVSVNVNGSTTLPNDGTWSSEINVSADSDPTSIDLAHTRFRVDIDYSAISGMAADQLALRDADSGDTFSPSAQSNGHVTFDVGADSALSPGSSTGMRLQLMAAQGAPAGTVSVHVSLISSWNGQDWTSAGTAASQDFSVELATTTAVTASSDPTDASTGTVTISAAVSPDPGTGTVEFLVDGAVKTASDLVAGSATAQVPDVPLGYHAISATYVGDTIHLPSTGTLADQLPVAPPGGSLHAITPLRLLDTRYGPGKLSKQLGAGKSVTFQVAGLGGIQGSGVAAVALNVTVVQPTGSGHVAVYASDRAAQGTWNIDFPKIVNTSGLVMTPLSSSGQVTILNESNGAVSLIADVSAWFGQPTESMDTALAGRYNALAPLRLVDTRKTKNRLAPGQTLSVKVAGVGDIPATGVGAVVLNVTTVWPSSQAWLELYPSGGTLPHVSTNAFQKGETRAGRVIVGVGPDGKVNVYNSPYASTDVVVDICGWFTDGSSSAGGSTFVPLLDSVRLTPSQTGGTSWGHLQAKSVAIAGVDGIPDRTSPIHPSAVVSNLHVSAPSLGGYLAAYPLDVRPIGSDVNFVKGQAVQNLGIAKLSDTGAFNLFHSEGTATVLIDVYGWFG